MSETQLSFQLIITQALALIVDFIYLSQGYAVEPIVPHLTREYHEASWLDVKILGDVLTIFIGLSSLKMHGDSTLQT